MNWWGRTLPPSHGPNNKAIYANKYLCKAKSSRETARSAEWNRRDRLCLSLKEEEVIQIIDNSRKQCGTIKVFLLCQFLHSWRVTTEKESVWRHHGWGFLNSKGFCSFIWGFNRFTAELNVCVSLWGPYWSKLFVMKSSLAAWTHIAAIPQRSCREKSGF